MLRLLIGNYIENIIHKERKYMDLNMFWTEKSLERNRLTMKYEPVQPFLFLDLLINCNCEFVFDIGANIGFYTLLSTLSSNIKKVHSFEAIEETFVELERNINMNSFDCDVSAHNLAVSNKKESLIFLVQDDDLSGINAVKESTFHDKSLFSTEKLVEADLLDDLFDYKESIIGFKIDVEGHELNVLNGCQQLLRNNKCFIQVESYADNENHLGDYLNNLGFSRFFKIGNDLYFSNITGLSDNGTLLLIVQNCLNKMIDYNLGRWMDNNSYLKLNLNIDGNSIVAGCNEVSASFSNDLEYAFYLLVDGSKEEVFWYSDERTLRIPIPSGIDSSRISVSCFVREKKYPEKKAMTTKSLV